MTERTRPEEVVKKAIEKGFDSVGFSGRSYMHWAEEHSMSLAGTERYKKHITKLKAEYAGKIKIFLGLEADIFSDVELSGYDYLIGSAHYFKTEDGYVGFDRSAEEVKRVIDACFHGDPLLFAKAYYEMERDLLKYGNFDIIGHFDLAAKQIENTALFDEEDKRYRNMAFGSDRGFTGEDTVF